MDESIIYFLFSKPRSFVWFPLSFLIRWSEFPKTFRPFNFFKLHHSSHVAICFNDTVYEAVLFLGVRKISLEKWRDKNEVNETRIVMVSKKMHDKALSYAEGSIGVPYAWLENIGIFICRVFLFVTGKEINNIFKSIKRKIKCTEFAYEIYRESGHKTDASKFDTIGVFEAGKLIK